MSRSSESLCTRNVAPFLARRRCGEPKRSILRRFHADTASAFVHVSRHLGVLCGVPNGSCPVHATGESLRRWNVAHAASFGSVESAVQRSGTGRIPTHQRRTRPLPPARVSARGRDRDAAATARDHVDGQSAASAACSSRKRATHSSVRSSASFTVRGFGKISSGDGVIPIHRNSATTVSS